MRSVYRVRRSCRLCSTPAASSTLPPATVAAARPTGPSFFSVLRIRDPVPFCPLDPGLGMDKKNQDPDHISESVETIFWVKILKFLDADADPDSRSGNLFEPGSGIRVGKKFGSGIRDKHSGSATLLFIIVNNFTSSYSDSILCLELPDQITFKRGFFYVRCSALLHLPPLRSHCVGGCWNRTQDCCAFGVDIQTL
jgi:hypothetical protein